MDMPLYADKQIKRKLTCATTASKSQDDGGPYSSGIPALWCIFIDIIAKIPVEPGTYRLRVL
jgi:hypothetical protein